MNKIKSFAISFLLAMVLTTGVARAAQYIIKDNFGYVWELDNIDSNANALYFAGTVTLSTGEVRNAVATYLSAASGAVSFSADAGSGVPFNYNVKWGSVEGKGVWINVDTAATHGTVTLTLGTPGIATVAPDGPLPGQ